MANIHFSLSGEGRGHAARAKTLTDELRLEHDVTIHTFGDALELLGRAYGGTEVRVEEIPGARFRYGSAGRVDLPRTAAGTLREFARTPGVIRGLTRRLEAEGADLVLTDFEPLLPRAARRAGVPVVGIDHQSALAYGDFRALEPRLRCHARLMGSFVRVWTPTPDLQISSSFYRPEARRDPSRVRFVGVLLRRALRAASPTDGEHVVAYLRRGAPRRALDLLARWGLEVRLYGRPAADAGGNLVHRPIDEAAFIEDLASCRAVVTTAGNQLVGEAIHLGKPVLALPEMGNREQEINAWFLERSGAGQASTFDRFRRDTLERFTRSLPLLRQRCASMAVDGTEAALRLIRSAAPA